MTSQQPTPRTDAHIVELDVAFIGADGLSSAPQKYVEVDFARALERENQELRKDNARLAALAAPQQFKDANGNTYEGNFVSTPAIDTTGADYIVAPDGSAKRVK